MFYCTESEIPDTKVHFLLSTLSLISTDQITSVYEGIKIFISYPSVRNSHLSLVTVSFIGDAYGDYTNPRIEYTLNLLGFERKKIVSFSRGNETPQQIAGKLIESFNNEEFVADFQKQSEQVINWRSK